MTYVGPWRDDADPVWVARDVASTGGSDTGRSMYYVTNTAHYSPDSPSSWTTAIQAAWNNEGTQSSSTGGTGSSIGANVANSGSGTGTTYDYAHFAIEWLSVLSIGAMTVTSAPTPAYVASDPNIVGIEWEPSSVALAAQLEVDVNNQINSPTDPGWYAGETFRIKLGAWTTTAPYAPGFMTGSQVAARNTLGTISPTADFGDAQVTLPLSVDPNSDYGLAVTVIDPFTQDQNPMPYPASGYVSSARGVPFKIILQAKYHLRYRLTYTTPPTRVETWVRTNQRGDKFIGAPRAIQNNSQQASLRNIGFR